MESIQKNYAEKNIHGSIPVRTKDETLIVQFAKIVHCVAYGGSYVVLHLSNNKTLTVCKGMKQLESELNHPCFFRSHKLYLINIAYVEGYGKDEAYDRSCVVTMCGGAQVKCSRRKKPAMIRIIKHFIEECLLAGSR